VTVVLLGLVGKIKLSIPVAGLSSQPWVIEVSNVYVVVKPRPHYQVGIQ